MSKFDSSSCAVQQSHKIEPKRKLSGWVMVGCVLVVPILVAVLALVGGNEPAAQAASVSWSSPVQAVPNSVFPFVRVAPNGTVGVAANIGGGGVSFSISTNHGQSFGHIATFTTKGNSARPTLAVDGNNNFYLTWMDRSPTNFHAFYVKINANGTYSQPLDLSNIVGIADSRFPAVAVSSDGRQIFIANQEGTAAGVFESDDAGNSWGKHVIVPGKYVQPGGGYNRITLDNANNPHMIFCGSSDGGNSVDVFTYDRDSSGNWTTSKVDNLGTPGGRAFYSDIATAPNGDLYAVWQEDLQNVGVSAPKEASAARWDHTTGRWQPETRDISQSNTNFGSSTPTVTVDGNGTAWFAWNVHNLTTNLDGVQYTYTSNGGQSYATPADALPSQYLRGTFSGGTDTLAFGGGNVYVVAQLADSSGSYGSWLASTPVTAVAPPVTTTAPPTPAFTPIPNARYSYFLPFLANNYNQGSGNFTSFVAFQNTGNAQAYVQVLYYDTSGQPVPTAANTCATVAQNGECVVPNPFPSGSRGSGIITSSQPLNVIVAEATPFGGSAYPVSAGASNSLVAPFAINGDYGFVTQLTVYNGSNAAANNIQVQFYDKNGNLQAGATQNISSLAARSSIALDQAASNSGLPVNFDGWAQITAPTGSQLAAQVLEQNPASHFVAIANAQPQAQTTVYAPAIFNGAFGGFVTGANVINPGSTPVTVTVTYYDDSGNPIHTAPFSLNPFAIQQIFHGTSTGGNGLPTGGLPVGSQGYAGAAVITATGGGVVVSVNEGGGLTANGSARSGVYVAATTPASSFGLPVMANNGSNRFTTGATVFNTSSSQATGTIQYYNLDGTPTGALQNFSVAAHGSYTAYQGASSQNLPNNFYGVAVVTETSGGSDFIATTNVQSPDFFYSYSEPNS